MNGQVPVFLTYSSDDENDNDDALDDLPGLQDWCKIDDDSNSDDTEESTPT